MYLVLLETAGNQNYIFATNRLRENVGASQLTHEAGTRYVLEGIHDIGGPSMWRAASAELRRSLSNALPFSDAASGGFEPITATSGKALVLVADPDKARKLVNVVTRRVLVDAPGLDLAGAIVEFDWDSDPLADAVEHVHRELEHVRTQRPGPESRYQALPVASRCSTSGLPAWGIDGLDRKDISRTSAVKRAAAASWLDRANSLVRGSNLTLVDNIDGLEKAFNPDFLAVVHADGNGVGAIFLAFGEHVDVGAGAAVADRNRAYANQLREFSGALETATQASFRDALSALPASTSPRGRERVPLAPIVLGGDDLTVVCDGRFAIDFARRFLVAFETHTAASAPIARILEHRRSGAGGLAACAGVAIVKPHFPFFSAYELSEQLLQSAKRVKREADASWSALDFHVLLDSSFTELADIRKRLTLRGGTRLYCRPFVVSKRDGAPPVWVDAHHIERLESRVSAMRAPDDEGRRKLPNGQLHDLREGLFAGSGAADARMQLIRRRYASCGFDALLEVGPNGNVSLFRHDTNGAAIDTRFLDALDASAFWGEE